ncbi:hypothetical protein [Nocardia mexicana]|uniref:Uncharacterized protein n=1 Tax=Nocardia mexicana TaxID=279262 RepID=A0A370H1J6_9NOCA|nr:hypothetical protein [Nocardia mexicana]RDI49393.1 hypothetical protein DFR68_107521 [Nocardia mexicana]
MRIFGTSCHSFEYTPISAGPGAVPLDRSAVGVTRSFFDCLLLQIAVEPGDHPLTTDTVRALRHLFAEGDSADIVVTGSPLRLSPGTRLAPDVDPPDPLVHVADTLDALADFTEQLETCGDRVHLLPFGWNIVLRADISAHSTTLSIRATDRSPNPDRRDGPSRLRRHCPHALISPHPHGVRTFRHY